MRTQDALPGANPCNPYAGKTIPARLVAFSYMIGKGDDGNKVAQLQAQLRARGLREMRSYVQTTGDARNWFEFVSTSRDVTLACDHIFDDQWNTKEGFRLHDWHVFVLPNRLAYCGYYLELSDEALEVRNVLVDGFCKHYFPPDCGAKFNLSQRALGSEYLREDELHLLRLLPVNSDGRRREPLTQEERDFILPLYLKAQTRCDAERAIGYRAKVLAELDANCEKRILNAKKERDGMRWLIEKGIPIDNAIYYNHTGRFCFGWRSPHGPEAAKALRDRLVEFPFPYDLKTSSTS